MQPTVVTVDRGLSVVLTMVMGAALFAAEACSGGDEHPPPLTNPGRTNPPGVAAGGGNPGGGGAGGDTAGGGGAGDQTSEVNPGNGLLPNPTDAIGAAIDGG